MSIKHRLKLQIIREKNPLICTIWLILYSLSIGLFFMYHNDLLLNITEPYLQHLPTGLIGVALVVSALVKAWAVIVDNARWRYIGVIILGSSWGALALLSFTYHLGSGYPDSSWINHGFAVIMAIIISYKGVFHN